MTLTRKSQRPLQLSTVNAHGAIFGSVRRVRTCLDCEKPLMRPRADRCVSCALERRRAGWREAKACRDRTKRESAAEVEALFAKVARDKARLKWNPRVPQ